MYIFGHHRLDLALAKNQDAGLGIYVRSENTLAEAWADVFASWALDEFRGPAGRVWENYMEPYMRDFSSDLAIRLFDARAYLGSLW